MTGLGSACGCFTANTDVGALAAFFPALGTPYHDEDYRLIALSLGNSRALRLKGTSIS